MITYYCRMELNDVISRADPIVSPDKSAVGDRTTRTRSARTNQTAAAGLRTSSLHKRDNPIVGPPARERRAEQQRQIRALIHGRRSVGTTPEVRAAYIVQDIGCRSSAGVYTCKNTRKRERVMSRRSSHNSTRPRAGLRPMIHQ